MCEKRPIVGSYKRLQLIATTIGLVLAHSGLAQEQAKQPVIDQVPFDRVTLNEANQKAVIDVQLLDFPERKVPDPLPTSGTLLLRRLSDPSTLYEVAWTDIAKVELYEQLVLHEAGQFVSEGKLDEAFRSLSFLHENYPNLTGLNELTEQYLQRDAKAAFDKGRYNESLAILAALYDLNPQRPGTARAVEAISNRWINERLADRDFAAARGILDSLGGQFPNLQLTNVAAWRQKFAEGAEKQLEAARQAIAAGDPATARRAIQRALAILPDSPAADELLAELKKRAPQIAVGVSQRAYAPNSSGLQSWADERVARLTNPRFVELVQIGPEGGEYVCRWAETKSDDSGLRLELKFNESARQLGITPDAMALQLLRMADSNSPEYRGDFANVFASAEIVDGESLAINWRYAYVKPEALLQFSLAKLQITEGEPIAYSATTDPDTPTLATYRRGADASAPAISEQLSPTEQQALDLLRKGDLDVIDQVPPWLLAQVKQVPGVAVGTYRMPTVHVLLLNYENPLLVRREFRRALCYAIDRPRLVAEILAGKEATPGFRALSGPLLAGVTVNDVLGYAYKPDLQPLPYEPRLAVVLATTARTTLAKQALIKAGKKNPTVDELPKPEPLVLLHPSDPVARTMCGVIKKQLDAVGIPVELNEQSSADDSPWDLRYAELCMWEPVIDARQLLGPGGLAGRSTPAMNLALRELDKSTNWSDARTRLQRIHQLAYDDLPVIPLWQTINYFAYRDSVTGISRDPVSLYQDVSEWQISYGLAENKR
jgi:hypothetical protein